MIGVQSIILSFILFIVPAIVGRIFSGVHKEKTGIVFSWVSGQVLLWAGFLAISIPFILQEKSFSLVVMVFGIYTVLLLAYGGIVWAKRYFFGKKGERTAERKNAKRVLGAGQCFLWVVFGILLLLQLILTVYLAYEEGDDAFYLAISTITEHSDTMYRMLPYTGLSTGLDARHGLAPFPIWIAYLARISGMEAITVAQIALPIVLIIMAYAIYYLIARELFVVAKDKIPFFLIVTEVLVLFGGYSVYTAENFLLVRASQGKAVIANIVIPFLLYLMMIILKKLQHREKISIGHWLLLASTMMSGCLCSTQGTILTCVFLGVTGLCTAAVYRQWKILIPMGMCSVVPVGVAFLYFILG